MHKYNICMYIYSNTLSQLANQIAGILVITITIRKSESRSEIAKMAKMNTCVQPFLVRGLKVNEGVTGPDTVLFLHRATQQKRAH